MNNATDQRTVSTCPVCGGTQWSYRLSVEGFRVVSCQECGLVLTNPQPSDAELGAIYNEDYFLVEDNAAGHQHTADLKAATADGYLDLLQQHGLPAGARLLEVGCGHGDFLARAAARGLDVTGVEYSEDACRVARGKLAGAGQVLRGEIGDLSARMDGQFDVVTASDVIEHVRDPRVFLAHAHRLLRPGGLLFLATPTLDSWSARLLGNRWMEFKPEHLWYFRAATLRRLLAKGGFGQTLEEPCYKTLSIDYIAGHFARYPVPGVSMLVGFGRWLTPRFLRRKPLRLVASGMALLSHRTENFPEQSLSAKTPDRHETVPHGAS